MSYGKRTPGTSTPRQETVTVTTGGVVGMRTDSPPRRSAGTPVCVTGGEPVEDF